MHIYKQVLINMPVIMIRGTAGAALKKIINREPLSYGQIVAKHWTPEGTSIIDTMELLFCPRNVC